MHRVCCICRRNTATPSDPIVAELAFYPHCRNGDGLNTPSIEGQFCVDGVGDFACFYLSVCGRGVSWQSQYGCCLPGIVIVLVLFCVGGGASKCWFSPLIYPPRVIGPGSASTHPLLVRDETNGLKVMVSGFPSAMSTRMPL